MRLFGTFEKVDEQIELYLSAQTPPDLFSMVFSRLEKECESQVLFFTSLLSHA